MAQRNIEAIGVPSWTDDEERFARELQRNANVKEVGLLTSPAQLKQAVQQSSSNDSGDVTWKVPSARIFFPANVPNLAYHHWTAGAALATSVAHKGGVAGAKAMAATVIDVLRDPSIVMRAKETFKAELGDQTYRSLLPPDQKPPEHLNETVMAKWRPLMESTLSCRSSTLYTVTRTKDVHEHGLRTTVSATRLGMAERREARNLGEPRARSLQPPEPIRDAAAVKGARSVFAFVCGIRRALGRLAHHGSAR